MRAPATISHASGSALEESWQHTEQRVYPLVAGLLPNVRDDECIRRNLASSPETALLWVEVCEFDPMADHPHSICRCAM